MFFIAPTVLLAAGEEIQKKALSRMQAPGRITFQQPDNDACTECHTDSDGSQPVVTEAHLANSVHEGLDCIIATRPQINCRIKRNCLLLNAKSVMQM
jgi:hypothetical protein